MKGRLVFSVIGLASVLGATDASAQNAESVAIAGCRRAVVTEVRKARANADSVLFTLYPQVFPRTQFETDIRDAGQFFDRVQRLWIPFGFDCTYNYQSSVATVVFTWMAASQEPSRERDEARRLDRLAAVPVCGEIRRSRHV